jgi:hypothetical protein
MSEILVDDIAAATGLSPVFARSAVVRALARIGIHKDSLNVDDYRRALPELERVVRVFLAPDELRRCMSSLERLGR